MRPKFVEVGLVLIIGVSCSFGAQSSDNDVCSNVEFRRKIMADVNGMQAIKAAGLSVIDLSEPKTIKISREPLEISCQFTATDSDGDTTRISIDISKNSLGDPIFKLNPVE